MRGTMRRRLPWALAYFATAALGQTVALGPQADLDQPAGLAQRAGVVGKWKLALDWSPNIDYGILEWVDANGALEAYIDGGPVNILRMSDDGVAIDLDWTDGGDRLHITVLEGTLTDGRLAGALSEGGRQTGAWFAEPWREHPDAGQPPQPVDLSGVWRSLSRGTHKDAFDLTPAGEALNDRYDPTFDDPHLRCVSGGMIRMEDGPMIYQIVHQEDHILILYEYFNEVRRIWTDGRAFPDGIEDAWLGMGYSIGHWEGATLVVETRGMKPGVWDAAGMPISPSAAVTERKYLDDRGRLHTEFRLSDPENYRREIYRHTYRSRIVGAVPQHYACDPHSFYRSMQLEGRLDEYWGRTPNRL